MGFDSVQSGHSVSDQVRDARDSIPQRYMTHDCHPLRAHSALFLCRGLLGYNVIHKGARGIVSNRESLDRLDPFQGTSIMTVAPAFCAYETLGIDYTRLRHRSGRARWPTDIHC